MFIIYKDGKEIGAMYYFGDALTSLLKAYKEQSTAPEDRARVLERTFMTMVLDEKEEHDITVPVAKEIGEDLKILKDGRVTKDSGNHDNLEIYRILVNKNLIKNIL